MSLPTVKLSSKGQVVIPSDIRKQLGLKQHDELEVRLEQDQIVMARAVQKKSWEELEGLLKGGRSLTKWLEEERRSEKERENRKLQSSSIHGPS